MRKIRMIWRIYGMLIVVICLIGCRRGIDSVSLGLKQDYSVARMQKLILRPDLTGDRYQWRMNDSVISNERELVFCQPEIGTYNLELEISIDGSTLLHNINITVWKEQTKYKPYIARVLEFCPAPGQFVNELPPANETDNEVTMLEKVNDYISENHQMLISLGGFGGYVTFAFDHSVCNIPNEYDFRIWGNAFAASSKQENRLGGSCEPGIVMVAMDKNGNGLPDDEWYELAGAEYYKPTTIHHYKITYYRPKEDHIPTPLAPKSTITDTSYILWRDNQGNKGYIDKLTYHQQPYYPAWIQSDSISFEGTLLPNNAVDEAGDGSYYVLYAYDWGYVDNIPNDSVAGNAFNIDWAVDYEGNKVDLPCIDFVRVYTGLNQQCGWLGETSTELSKAVDLHINE